MGEEGLGRMLLGLDKSCHVYVCVRVMLYYASFAAIILQRGGGGGEHRSQISNPYYYEV